MEPTTFEAQFGSTMCGDGAAQAVITTVATHFSPTILFMYLSRFFETRAHIHTHILTFCRRPSPASGPSEAGMASGG